ncbi:hypothetical protein EON64_19125 [archaeon]|nr:MAG: hypothetical protein EON64_19125 [archaeon]
MHSTFYRPHCQGVPKGELVEGQDYFVGEEAALAWFNRQNHSNHGSIEGDQHSHQDKQQQQQQQLVDDHDLSSKQKSADRTPLQPVISEAVIELAEQITTNLPAVLSQHTGKVREQQPSDHQANTHGGGVAQEKAELAIRVFGKTRRWRAVKATTEQVSMPLTPDVSLHADLHKSMRLFLKGQLLFPEGDVWASFYVIWRLLKRCSNNWRVFFCTANDSYTEVFTRTPGCTAENYLRPCYRKWEDYFVGKVDMAKYVVHQARLLHQELGIRLEQVFRVYMSEKFAQAQQSAVEREMGPDEASTADELDDNGGKSRPT